MSNVVNLSSGRSRSSSAFEDLRRLVEDDLEAVNRAIVARMESPVALIPQLAGHLVASGGKRLRPMLTLASARLCAAPGNRQVLLAACVEFIHTATLLHDDVVDESDLRRGQASANAVWGNQASVLVGDFLFSRAFELMVEDGSLRVMEILSRASSVIAEGEVLQLTTANDTETDEAAYLEVIESKTARLFAAACQIGAGIAERPAPEDSAVQEKLGKTVGDDFREGKITLPVILSFRRGGDEERAFWRRTLEDLEQDEAGADLARAQGLMARHGALDDTVKRARHYGDQARDALAIFPESPMKSAMLEIVDFCIERAF